MDILIEGTNNGLARDLTLQRETANTKIFLKEAISYKKVVTFCMATLLYIIEVVTLNHFFRPINFNIIHNT